LDVVFYALYPRANPLSQYYGLGQFIRAGSLGELEFTSNEVWRGPWSQIIPGKFSDSPYTDLLFYEPASGRGEFYHTDAGGLGPNFATYTDWRTTWSFIAHL
jgi:hypothetical protein